METEVTSRLERVSESIAIKNDKLSKLKSVMTENLSIISNLKQVERSLEGTGALDFHIAKEKASLQEYVSRNEILSETIGITAKEILANKENFSKLIGQVSEIVENSNKEILQSEVHCASVEETVSSLKERNLMANEDLLSTTASNRELSRHSKEQSRVVTYPFLL